MKRNLCTYDYLSHENKILQLNFYDFCFSLFAMYCERILIPELQKVTGSIEVKMTTVGYTKLLCECPDLYRPDGKYRGLWVKIMEVSISDIIR